MSIRDSASGSSDWHGGGGSFNNGGGGAQNGGVGGGRGGGGYGGGAGYNGGLQSRQGLQTGNTIYGNTAFGRPGGMAQGYATRDPRSLNAAGMGPSIGAYGNFMDRQGNPMFSGALGGSSFYGRNAQQALSQAQREAAVAQAYPAVNKEMGLPTYPPNVQPVSAPPPMPSAFSQPWLNKISNFYNYIQRNYPVTPQPPRIGGMVGGRGMVGYDADVAERRAPGTGWGGVDIQNGINGMNGH